MCNPRAIRSGVAKTHESILMAGQGFNTEGLKTNDKKLSPLLGNVPC